MEIFKQIAPLKAFLKSKKLAGKTVGLVPTMGALHEGHLTLIRASQNENDITVATIYVNPTQFNNPKDLLKYPRLLDKDTELLQEVQCDVLFCPADEEMYPEKSILTINFGPLNEVMEGKFRPGHFSGVALIVGKLFNIIEPDRAYFGQKDWQQFAVITRLVKELKYNLQLRSVPTLREPNGLALSSRNLRLTSEQRAKASVFHKALQEANINLLSGKSSSDVKRLVARSFYNDPEVRLEYFELADSENLNVVENVSASVRPIMCIAGYVGEVRLIDNMFLGENVAVSRV
jgi:pantoate--beta-alanine ligase